MDFHPFTMSIVCTLKEDLLFSLKYEEGINDGISSAVQMPVRGEQATIPFTEMPGLHYHGIVWAHFSRLGSTWAMHMSIGIPHNNSSSSQKEGPITILRMEFFDDPSQATDGIFMMESDIYTEEDWDEIKSSELERWIEQGLDMDRAYEQALSGDETEPERGEGTGA
jgi:hypothetical protein